MDFGKPSSPHGTLLALSTMKDECPFVVEWVAHHLAVGFTQIIVYTNDCTDGTDTMLNRLEALDIGVHHRVNTIPPGVKPQPSMLRHAADDALVCASDWVLILDADEFMVVNHPSGTLDGLVDDLTAMNAQAMVLTWRIFGSGGIRDWTRAPVTDQFTRAAPDSWFMGWGTKTMFRYDPKYLRPGVHRPVIKAQHKDSGYPDTVLWVNGSGRPLEDWFKFRGWRSIRRTVGFDWGQINHYAIKSMDAYALRKLRGNVNLKKDKYNTEYWSLQDRNEVEDRRIARHRERRDQIIQALLSDDEVRRLHEAAHARVEARLAEHRQTEAYAELVRNLVIASDVPISQVVAKPPKARDPEAIKAVQTRIERRRNDLPKENRRTPPPPGWGSAFASAYVSQPTVSDPGTVLDEAENQTLMIPLDPGIFTPASIEALRAGKFDRRHARNINTFLSGCTRLLDLGCGVGFVALRARAANPDLAVTLHDERPALLAFARRIVARNFADPRQIAWSQATLNPDGHWSGLGALIADARPDALRLSSPILPVEAFSDAALAGVRRILIPFLDPAEIADTRARLAPALATLGFAEDANGEPNGSLCFCRE